jgi:hypothetical protein
MKSLSLFILSLLFLSFSLTSSAQTATEKFKVSGECGMCKKKIETAAKNAGATYAVWNKDTKQLVIKYNSNNATVTKIQQAIAGAGYDTPEYKASDEAYNQLDDCCKYERDQSAAKSSTAVKACCTDEKCMKDGKCIKGMSSIAGHEKDCCQKS